MPVNAVRTDQSYIWGSRADFGPEPLDNLFDGIDCIDPPDPKFGPTRISMVQPYTCYLSKQVSQSAVRGLVPPDFSL